jgi:hypothetical protein
LFTLKNIEEGVGKPRLLFGLGNKRSASVASTKGTWTNTDFKVSSACTLVVESEESVLAMQSLKSIAESLLRQASAKTIFSKVQPSPSQGSQTNACRPFFIQS